MNAMNTMNAIINILLVDDERRNLDALEAILLDPGYRILRAEDADAALRLLLEHDVAAIVLDIKMPRVTGFELARIIQGTKRFRPIPIVFLTAYMVDDQDVLNGYGAGAVDYLTKPVSPDILRHKVSVFAELWRKTRALAELNQNLEARVEERTLDLARSEEALRAASEQKGSLPQHPGPRAQEPARAAAHRARPLAAAAGPIPNGHANARHHEPTARPNRSSRRQSPRRLANHARGPRASEGDRRPRVGHRNGLGDGAPLLRSARPVG